MSLNSTGSRRVVLRSTSGADYDLSSLFGASPSVADTNLSGTIATASSSVSITIPSGVTIEVVNPSTATLWVRWNGTPAVNGPGSVPLNSLGSYGPLTSVSGTLQILSTIANQPYTVNRFTPNAV